MQGFTRKDAEKVEHMHATHKLILKGGTDKTRAALYRDRTKELIEEAHITNKGKSAHHI